MKLLIEWTEKERELAVKAICSHYGYSDTKTVRTEKTVTDSEWIETIEYTDTIVPVDPTSFAFEKAQEWLGGMIDKYNESVASQKKAEELARIESEIQAEVLSNKVNFK